MTFWLAVLAVVGFVLGLCICYGLGLESMIFFVIIPTAMSMAVPAAVTWIKEQIEKMKK
ncbi:MAG: hypothetical protein J6Q54_05895 [Oscillospiraceae bacterium]|nr:hypothetical protein [Oscillospiraceae bacterium]